MDRIRSQSANDGLLNIRGTQKIMNQWNFTRLKRLVETAAEEPGSVLNIVRLAPGDGCVEWEWKYEGDESEASKLTFLADIRLRGEQGWSYTRELDQAQLSARIGGLNNGVDYELRIRATEKEPALEHTSPIRLVRPGVAQGTVINYIHPEDYTFNFSGRSPASPSIAKLPDGRWVASHDVFWGAGGQNLTFVFRSEDEGRTWSYLTALYPCFWGKLFVHRDTLYMLATSTEYGDLLIGRSDNGGADWSAPTTLIGGGSREEGGPHKAPQPVIAHKGRLWSAVEYGSWPVGGYGAGVVSAPENSDLLDSANWTATPFLRYDCNWPGTIDGGDRPGYLEGNAVVRPDGQLVNILRYSTRGGIPDYGRAIMLNVNADDPDAPLAFAQVIDFPGNMSKFTIRYDSVSHRYWALVNRVSSGNVRQRNILTLTSSADAIHWAIHRDILNYEDNGWPEDNTKVGFQYADWMIIGEDIAFVSRTAIHGAYSYHNANHLTFHRIENFRIV
jgi:hypothetical protein